MMRARVIVLAALAVTLFGCPKPEGAPTQDAGITVPPDAGAQAASSGTPGTDPRELVIKNCMSCHTDEMLMQQRLTEAQWTAVVKKMTTWGAPLDPGDDVKLVAYLSASYGPDAGAFVPPRTPASDVAAALEPQPDGAYAGGDPAKGKLLFEEKCGTCHGTNARGLLGVNLVDRPILYRAQELAQTVRKGRGRMLPVQITDVEQASVIAYLRTLHDGT